MLATGVAGGVGTFTNIRGAYGEGTALGAVAAGEGATAVLALVLLGLTMLGQSSPWPVRAGLWTLPAAASVMAAMAAADPGRTVIYAVTPMGMCVAAEGMAFLARRIVVHLDGRDAEADRKAANVMRALAYHRARAANHPDPKVQEKSVRTSWRLARKVGTGDVNLGERLLDVQRERVALGADSALEGMFALPVTPPVTPGVTPDAIEPSTGDASRAVTPPRDTEGTQVSPHENPPGTVDEEPADTPPDAARDGERDAVQREPVPVSGKPRVTLEDVATVAGVPVPNTGEALTDEQIVVTLRFLRYTADPPLSYRQATTAFREAGYVGGEKRVRDAWGALLLQEESTS
ncbi:hypothetical protein [Streptomyces cacaoi]|uniref:hypothetical protein n=1 Tax=Streptomyces cacaoi TaxID=1898 RepID=UPI00263549FC|nr:hypothetical protein [Streptomyces cacaoi]